MAKQEYSRTQEKIISDYYKNLDAIKLQSLQELVTELYLADSESKRENLWKRVDKAMAAIEIPASIRKHILEKKDPAVLASNINDWLK
ncbi:hypothetical protein SMSP2_00468 [Limihaloglobus sulfuriphilus]|uniref:Uncharacterized protein n=1 Tax=Limihaloglobus sulfuriphilus TaxID=1851148 RepID=A0A1Q2MCU5_9BACT|nr:hypothetical protein [Limihaloglobus sulfuriphilus]AQQ70127.1 hypothetical protein SMSP2_00468 [Limihaloglobus sulfuriphilus]